MYDLVGAASSLLRREQWLVPHFEKMLYDNALLAPVYLHAWVVTAAGATGRSPKRRSTTCSRAAPARGRLLRPRRMRTPTASRD